VEEQARSPIQNLTISATARIGNVAARVSVWRSGRIIPAKILHFGYGAHRKRSRTRERVEERERSPIQNLTISATAHCNRSRTRERVEERAYHIEKIPFPYFFLQKIRSYEIYPL
jgi:hypothetical protein